jgi:prepilin-type N-terminal cleavage/methylation domain-containing protein
MMRKQTKKRRSSGQGGFTLVELLIASVVFMVGVVAVFQMVPASTQSNLRTRVDTSSVVIAQREMHQMVNQPLSNASFTDTDGNVCSLGSSASPNTVVGSPLVQVGLFVKIDYSAAKTAGYNFQFTNPQNPSDGSYDVRWAVITQVNAGGSAVSKRFIIGAQRKVGPQILPPVSLDTWQQKTQ